MQEMQNQYIANMDCEITLNMYQKTPNSLLTLIKSSSIKKNFKKLIDLEPI